MKVIEKEFKLIPPHPSLCQECAVSHKPTEPHNAGSLYYQVMFSMKHKRAPKWTDAMAHCDQDTKEKWSKLLAEHGADT